eukprot:PhM_4_TR4182/c0_g1_i1/m.84557
MGLAESAVVCGGCFAGCALGDWCTECNRRGRMHNAKDNTCVECCASCPTRLCKTCNDATYCEECYITVHSVLGAYDDPHNHVQHDYLDISEKGAGYAELTYPSREASVLKVTQ